MASDALAALQCHLHSAHPRALRPRHSRDPLPSVVNDGGRGGMEESEEDGEKEKREER